MSLHGDDESDDDLGSDEELDAEQLAAVWRNPRFQKRMENFRRSVRLGEPAFALADAPLRDGAAVAVVRDHARRRREAFRHGEVAIPWTGYADREYQRREHGLVPDRCTYRTSGSFISLGQLTIAIANTDEPPITLDC